MKQELYVHIPQPCHEDWNNMTPVDKGKFCNSCSKQVVDFSNMTDYEVLNFFTKNAGKVCGRFANDQLQRPLQPIKIEKKKTWWIAALMPLLLLFGKANAQKKKQAIPSTSEVTKNLQPIIMGKVAAPGIRPEIKNDSEIIRQQEYAEDSLIKECIRTVGDTVMISDQPTLKKETQIQGKITDEKGEPLRGATIIIKGSNLGTSSREDGTYSLIISNAKEKVQLLVSFVGFEEKEISVNLNIDKDIQLKPKYALLNEVVVNATLQEYITKGLTDVVLITVGGAVACKKVTHRQIIDTTIRKVFQSAAFKTFPNPVARGSQLHIDTKQAGEYSIQLFDNSSKLLLANNFAAIEGATVSSINIPSTFAGGTYYIRIVDNKKKKQFTDKIIIQ